MTEHEEYVAMMEDKLIKYNKVVENYEKQINIFKSIVQMQEYLNSLILSSDLFNIMNDLLIGVLGVQHCTITQYINRKYVVKSSNLYDIGSIIPLSSNTDGIYSHVIKKNDSTIFGFIEIRTKYKSIIDENFKLYMSLIANQMLLMYDNRRLYDELEDKICEQNIDLLTGCVTRRRFFELTSKLLCNDMGYSLIMLDIDRFKSINDTYGHQAGDEVLKFLGNLLCENIRRDDIACRYGGEEFLLLLHGIHDDITAINKADKLRSLVDNSIIKFNDIDIHFTVSIGISIYSSQDLEKSIEVADKKLYSSKNSGRNKVSI